MIKKVFCIAVLTIAMLFPIKISAQCSNSEIIRRSSLAKNISITYNYIEENGQVSFYITLSNLQPDFYIKDVQNQKQYYYTSNEIVLYGYKPNTSYRFDVYGVGECNERLYSHYVNLPGYNPYYNDPICVGVNSSICQKWVNINYNYDTFVKEVNKIKQKTQVKEENQVEEEPLGIYDYILKFFISYYYIILPIIIVVCLVIIIIQNKKRKKEDLF